MQWLIRRLRPRKGACYMREAVEGTELAERRGRELGKQTEKNQGSNVKESIAVGTSRQSAGVECRQNHWHLTSCCPSLSRDRRRQVPKAHRKLPCWQDPLSTVTHRKLINYGLNKYRGQSLGNFLEALVLKSVTLKLVIRLQNMYLKCDLRTECVRPCIFWCFVGQSLQETAASNESPILSLLP